MPSSFACANTAKPRRRLAQSGHVWSVYKSVPVIAGIFREVRSRARMVISALSSRLSRSLSNLLILK